MSASDRRAMVERSGKDLSVRRQCALVGVARSGIYRPKPVAEADDLAVMRHIDELPLDPDGVRLPLSGGDHRLGQPSGSGMAAVEHQRCEILRGGAGGGAASFRKAAHFQYR